MKVLPSNKLGNYPRWPYGSLPWAPYIPIGIQREKNGNHKLQIGGFKASETSLGSPGIILWVISSGEWPVTAGWLHYWLPWKNQPDPMKYSVARLIGANSYVYIYIIYDYLRIYTYILHIPQLKKQNNYIHLWFTDIATTSAVGRRQLR